MDETLKDAMINAVVEAARATYPNVQMATKYGGTVFMTQDGTLVSGVYAYKGYVSVEFSQGATFEDPHRLLEGKGKARRHVKLHSLSDVDAKQVTGFLKQTFA